MLINVIGNQIGGLNTAGLGGGNPLIQPWLDRATVLGYTLPSAPIQSALITFTNSLNSAGLWSRMKTGYIMHAGSLQMGTLNIKDPLTYVLSDVSSPSFSEGNGTRSNGISSYRNQPFKSNEFSGIETNLTSVQYVSESSVTGAVQSSHGMRTDVANFLALLPATTGPIGNSYVYGTVLAFTSGNHRGLYVQISTNTNSIVYKDGTKTTGAITPTVPTTSQNRLILAVNNNATTGVTPIQFYNKYVALDFLFDGFNDTDELNFRTAFNTYKTTVGLP